METTSAFAWRQGKPKGPKARWSAAGSSRFFNQQCLKPKKEILQFFSTCVLLVHNIRKFISYFALNSLRPHFKEKLVKDIYRNECCLFWELHEKKYSDVTHWLPCRTPVVLSRHICASRSDRKRKTEAISRSFVVTAVQPPPTPAVQFLFQRCMTCHLKGCIGGHLSRDSWFSYVWTKHEKKAVY